MRNAAPWTQAQLLLQRLERISADSRWAHLASGYRGAILKLLDEADVGQLMDDIATRQLEQLMDGGGAILIRAAYERIARRKI